MSCALDLYGDALKGFSKDTLAFAYQNVKANHKAWGWPEVGYFTKACRDIEERKGVAVIPSSQRKYPWQAKADEAIKIKDRFMENFQHDALAKGAKAEGWYVGTKGLRNYADAHATLQAQIISGQRNLLWDSWAWGHGTWQSDTTYDFHVDLQSEISATRSTMTVQVMFPEIAERWMKNRLQR